MLFRSYLLTLEGKTKHISDLLFLFLRGGFSGGSVIKNLPANAGNAGSIPGSGISAGRNGNPLQYSCLANPMDRAAWRAVVHGVAKEPDTTQQLNNDC